MFHAPPDESALLPWDLVDTNQVPTAKPPMIPPKSSAIPSTTTPRLTNLMNPEFFNKSTMGTAWQAQKDQPFGKDNLGQVFLTTEKAFPSHVVFPVLNEGLLNSDDMSNLFVAMPSLRTLWKNIIK
jgi:hypothetical protein